MYEYLLDKNPSMSSIGFTATPPVDCHPFPNILTRYSIYDALEDGVVVKPVVKWISSQQKLNELEMIKAFEKDIRELPYGKIVIWCGTIESCYRLAELWGCVFRDYTICIDTSVQRVSKWKGYSDFYNCEDKALLFCAGKHREGSDIPNLDCCIFLDRVTQRGARLFMQSLGRVIRLDPRGKKHKGLIIDAKAKNSIEVCNRISSYIEIDPSYFPWKYEYSNKTIGRKRILIHELELLTKKECIKSDVTGKRSIPDGRLEDRFIRPIPDCNIYRERLQKEMELINEKSLSQNILLALEVLEITQNIPHVTRGSCGSSLVCYLLGISHVDPIKYGISFARFLNEYRNNLPDIDFDFPHSLRDEVFLKMQSRWPGQIARISNHVHYHEKSALREAMRRNGVKGFVGKYDVNNVIYSKSPEVRKNILKTAKQLEDTFRCYSLHCGGIVFYADGVPDEAVLNRKRSVKQIKMNKEDVARDRNFKIDILSSRALSQLYMARQYEEIDFYANQNDPATAALLSKGDNIGLTLAESPLMRKAMLRLKPTNLDEVAACLAIIRPTAKDVRDSLIPVSKADLNRHIVYDDDAIRRISHIAKCDEGKADYFRRGFAKGSKPVMREFRNLLDDLVEEKKMTEYKANLTMRQLKCLRKYGFCKAHAYSYAQLVWQLAYTKVHSPKRFWRGALRNCSSFYRKWVHMHEASRAGIDIKREIEQKDKSVYAIARQKSVAGKSKLQQLRETGYWDMDGDNFIEGCYMRKKEDRVEFNGLIACSRILSLSQKGKNSVALFVGTGNGNYIELTVSKKFPNLTKMVGVKGSGIICDKITGSILSKDAKFY